MTLRDVLLQASECLSDKRTSVLFDSQQRNSLKLGLFDLEKAVLLDLRYVYMSYILYRHMFN